MLDEDHAPHAFLVPEVFALYLRIGPTIWDEQIRERFERLKHDVWLPWLRTAAGQIQARLRDPDTGEIADDCET